MPEVVMHEEIKPLPKRQVNKFFDGLTGGQFIGLLQRKRALMLMDVVDREVIGGPSDIVSTEYLSVEGRDPLEVIDDQFVLERLLGGPEDLHDKVEEFAYEDFSRNRSGRIYKFVDEFLGIPGGNKS